MDRRIHTHNLTLFGSNLRFETVRFDSGYYGATVKRNGRIIFESPLYGSYGDCRDAVDRFIDVCVELENSGFTGSAMIRI
jgi:uncharacterized protein YegP (UPF0339 family)